MQSGQLKILDDIGPSWAGMVSAESIHDQLDSLGPVEQLDVIVNSRGGSVFEGFAIYNLLKKHPAHVRVHVEGVAASSAATVSMAGDEIILAQNAWLMIHDPSAAFQGNAEDFRKQADRLDSLKVTIAQVYADRSGMDRDDVLNLMASETWFSAESALAHKLATSIDGNKTAVLRETNRLTERFPNLPKSLVNQCTIRPRLNRFKAVWLNSGVEK